MHKQILILLPEKLLYTPSNFVLFLTFFVGEEGKQIKLRTYVETDHYRKVKNS